MSERAANVNFLLFTSKTKSELSLAAKSKLSQVSSMGKHRVTALQVSSPAPTGNDVTGRKLFSQSASSAGRWWDGPSYVEGGNYGPVSAESRPLPHPLRPTEVKTQSTWRVSAGNFKFFRHAPFQEKTDTCSYGGGLQED